MTPDRWEQLKGTILDRFEIIERATQPLERDPGTVELLVFKSPAGVIKLEFTRKPRVIGERGMGSRRIGSAVIIQRAYSDEDEVSFLKAFRQGADQSWTEIDPQALT